MTARRKHEILWLLLGGLSLITLSALTTMQLEGFPLFWRRVIAVSLALVGIGALPMAQYASGKLSARTTSIWLIVIAALVLGGVVALWA